MNDMQIIINDSYEDNNITNKLVNYTTPTNNMLSQPPKTKQPLTKPLQTKPSHQHQPSSQFQSVSIQNYRHSIRSFNNPNLGRIDKVDSEIRFDNGWMYSGQHCENKFHGWGTLTDCQHNQVYKGNFCEGYFHGYGIIRYRPIFQYLVNVSVLHVWVEQALSRSTDSRNNLNQVLVTTNPQQKTLNNSNNNKNNQTYTFQKRHPYNANDDSPRISTDYHEVTSVKWISYKGQFNEGNITGFGTLEINIYTQHNEHEYRQSNSVQTQSCQTLCIVGKFRAGQILACVIKW